MLYQGRHIDPISLWSEFVEFPQNMDTDTEFTPLVQCPNPDHDTMKRHFQLNLQKPLVHCFAGCGISGTYEHALSMITGETRRNVRKRILRHSRLTAPAKKRRNRGRTAKAVSPGDLRYERYLPPIALEYLSARGISDSTVAAWELGWDAEQRRIVIPVKDERGRLLFLIKRAVRVQDNPRYLYPDGSDRNGVLFGIGHIDLGVVKSAGLVVVEGSLDTIINHQNGLKNTIGILGSHLSEIQARKIANLRPVRVYTMFDADAAGVGATISVTTQLQRVPIFICRYPKGKTDPAQLDRQEANRSIERAISAQAFHKRVGIARATSQRERISRFA